MGRNRRKYSEDFKRDAVSQLITSGKSVAENLRMGRVITELKQERDILKKGDSPRFLKYPGADFTATYENFARP